MSEYVDVLIVGAGLSGIGAAYHLQTQCPDRSYAIVEARAKLGGTWDLFRYPGVRSDSDMHTLGYAFRPWTDGKALADGPSILRYIQQTAEEHHIADKIRYRHRVKHAAWSSETGRWSVELAVGEAGTPAQLTCSFLFMCSGYYRYDAGYTPELPGAARFQGDIVHPQRWTDDVLYAERRVVVIGSGATAVTLVPSLAQQAAHVTMLQRSPTYILSAPAEDGFAKLLRRVLPPSSAHRLTRWRNIVFGMLFFQLARRLPAFTRRHLLRGVRDALGPAYDVDTHFAPRYKPWDQRLCLVPDGDLFEAIKSGRASVVTDEIETLTETGIQLRSGKTLPADLIVTATGLNLLVMGGVSLRVDGRAVKVGDAFGYKGMMLSDVPNLALALGYTNASWTLKCDLTCGYVCRLLNHMAKHGYDRCTPRNRDPALGAEPWTNLASSYVLRAVDQFPKQGTKAPWRLHQNYARDLLALRFGRLDDGVLEFARGEQPAAQPEARAALPRSHEST